jgi:hypothetical protein
LSKLGGAEVQVDPRSSDFGKIKIGDTRYDVLAGFQQYIRLASQLSSGKIISSTSGREITLGEGYKPLTRKDIIIRFFESKEAPIASFATGLLTGQDVLGRPFNVPTEVASRFTPMVAQDIYDLWQDKGLEGLVYGLPTPFGVGTQTYGKVQLVTGKNPIGQPTSQIRAVPGLDETITNKIFGQQTLGSSRSFDVETYYDQLLKQPPEQAQATFEEIATSNPDLAEQIVKVAEDRKLGITAHDKDLKSKGVASGDRALAIVDDFNKLKTKEEKAALWEEYVTKKIITKDVAEQLTELLH